MRILTFLAVGTALTLAGCRQAGDDLAALFPGAEAYLPDQGDDDQDERRRRAIAWLQSDLDGDGLSNEIELEFGLDPDDPTDGPDIDGDGIPNYRDGDADGDGILNRTDPDIDGDGLFNIIDSDIDGDAVPNAIDFDVDTDGVRRRWDWDSDSDGEDDDGREDDGEDGDDDGDEDGDEDDEATREAYAQMAAWVDEVFGHEKTEMELANDYAQMAAWVEDVFADDDAEDENDRDGQALRSFQAAVIQLARRGERGDATARDELHELLKAIDDGQPRVIRADSDEARLIEQTLGDRFRSDDFDKTDVGVMLDRLMLARPMEEDDTDATDALDVLFRHGTELRDPWGSDAPEEYQARIDNVVRVADNFSDAALPACSDAVSKLVDMPREGSLQDKVSGVARLRGVVDEPELGALMSGLEALTQALEQRVPDWGWNAVFDSLESAPGIEDGIGSDVIDHVVEDVSET